MTQQRCQRRIYEGFGEDAKCRKPAAYILDANTEDSSFVCASWFHASRLTEIEPPEPGPKHFTWVESVTCPYCDRTFDLNEEYD